MSDENPHIAEFISITNSSKSLAEQYLQRNNNDLVEAIEDYYANSEHGPQPTEQHEPPILPQGSVSNQAGTSQKKRKAQGGIKTFRDLNNEEEDSEDESTSNNFFTGGEKSALQVEDPNKDRGNGDQNLIDQIFQRAREQMNLPDDRPSAQQQPQSLHETAHFTGTGFKLGDGNEPSEQIEDPHAQARELLNRFRPKKVNREITFWRQGFTVGDSKLYSYDDEKNKRILSEIEQGRVPIAILQVDPGDDVDVTVSKRTDEDYVPPKRKVGGYHGSGHRLGSPVPGEPIATEGKEDNVEETKPETANKTVDEGEGDTAVQIRFANGKRTSHKFNSSDPISVVYNFVRNHDYNTDSAGRNFTLSHAFPVKPIEESNDISIADAKLKNSVIVQRWV
ncbi:SHP1 [Candida margitis]|uniref:SHP1 n=1 Tax=Candida margitis TaxID=1775924 RepID=UPI0022260E0F|nr:SHP1 [Candida margitis]KAI5967752.1 SHP1 [Candida margitis]